MEMLTAVSDYYLSSSLGIIELIGSAFSLLSVWFAYKHSRLTWVFGLLGVLCYGYLFLPSNYNLPADAALQFLFYVPVQFIGFYTWWRIAVLEVDDEHVYGARTFYPWITVAVSILTLASFTGEITVAVWGSEYAFWDAVLVWSSVFAQVLMAKKYWESWVLWVAVDLIAPVLYFNKELYVVAGVYVVFLALAVTGLISWHKRYRWQRSWIGHTYLPSDEVTARTAP